MLQTEIFSKQDFHINNVFSYHEKCDQIFLRHNFTVKSWFDVTSTYSLKKAKEKIPTLLYMERQATQTGNTKEVVDHL